MDLGLIYSTDDPNSVADPEVIAVSQRITPNQAPSMGKVYELFGERREPITTDQFDVLNRGYTTPTFNVTASTSGSDWDNATDTTDLPIPASQANSVLAGDVVKVEDEIMVVSSVTRTSGSEAITVYARGAGETTGVAHGTTAVALDIIGNAFAEAKVATEGSTELTEEQSNYCQLFSERIEYTLEDANTPRREEVVTIQRKEDEAMARIERDLARTAISGTAQQASGDQPRLTRGLAGFLGLSAGNALSHSVGGAFTLTALNNLLSAIAQRGGSPNAIVMSHANKTVFNGLSSADGTRQDVNDTRSGRVITRYLSDEFGELQVVVDLDMPNSEIDVVDSTKMTKGWKTGDTIRMADEPSANSRQFAKTIQGALGLSVENVGTSHGELTNLNT